MQGSFAHGMKIVEIDDTRPLDGENPRLAHFATALVRARGAVVVEEGV